MTEATTQDLNPSTTTVAAWLARAMKERGIDRIFGLQGGHIQPIWDHSARNGIRIIDVRDERAAVHMAHAHAELTGGFGVANKSRIRWDYGVYAHRSVIIEVDI